MEHTAHERRFYLTLECRARMNLQIYSFTQPDQQIACCLSIHPSYPPTIQPISHLSAHPTIYPASHQSSHPTIYSSSQPVTYLCLSIHPSIDPATQLSTYLSLHLSIHPCIDPASQLFILPAYLFIYHLSIHPSIHLSKDQLLKESFWNQRRFFLFIFTPL